MLPQANNIFRPDDLQENAITVVDGGDGVLNGTDYILFYSNGADTWLKDSLNRRFSHKKNLYSDSAFYYLSISANGKRIATLQNNLSPNITITSFTDHFFHELNRVMALLEVPFVNDHINAILPKLSREV